MKAEVATKWEAIDGVDRPCADFSFEYRPPHQLLVRMHYSRALGNPSRDLELEFSGAIAFRWEEEAIGLNPLPANLPKCSDGKWTFPLLKIENSIWLKQNEEYNPVIVERREHFAFVTMNDLGQVLALSNPTLRWIDAEDAV